MAELASERHAARRSVVLLLAVWALAMLLAPLVVHAYGGSFARYVADDFCTAAKVREVGLWPSQQFWYAEWTGRYAYNGVLALLEVAGPAVVPLLPGLTLAAWTWVLAWTYRWGLMSNHREDLRQGLAFPLGCAALTIGATLFLTPNVYQSLYWQTGLVNYMFPIVLLTLQAGIVIRGRAVDPAGPRRTIIVTVVVGLLAILSAAFSETYLLAQVLLYLAGWAWLGSWGPADARRQGWTLAAAGLVATAIAGVVVVLAPGNAIRMSSVAERAGILDVLLSTARYSAAFVYRTATSHPVGLVSLAVVSAAIGSLWRPSPAVGGSFGMRGSKGMLTLFALGAGLIYASILPSAYAVGAYPVDRALTAPTYVLALMVLGGAGLIGCFLGSRGATDSMRVIRRWALMILVVGCTWWAVGAIRDGLPWVRDAQDYAAQWDRRLTAVEAAQGAGAQTLALSPLPHIGFLGELGGDPSDWVNTCFAQYFGLSSVVAK